MARRWVNDLRHAENCINQNFSGAAMPQSAFEAMTDAAFNVGCTGLMWYRDRSGNRRHRHLEARLGAPLGGDVRETDRFCQQWRTPLWGLVNHTPGGVP